MTYSSSREKKDECNTYRVNPRPLHQSSDLTFNSIFKNSYSYYRDGVQSIVWVLVPDLLPSEHGSCYDSICIGCVVTYYLIYSLCDVNQPVSCVIAQCGSFVSLPNLDSVCCYPIKVFCTLLYSLYPLCHYLIWIPCVITPCRFPI